MARHVRLLSGSLDEKTEQLAEDGSYIDKKCMIVYTGKFESMDGPVEVKDEDVEALAANHNGMLAKLSRLAGGEVQVKHNPPIQLDHSTSAKDTVGRLRGNLSVGVHETEEGPVKALYGNMRILGAENVEKIKDGRWTHLSMGADLENHKLSELTITPFPAAADASMLGARMGAVSPEQEYENQDIYKAYKGFEIGLIVDEGQMYWNVYKHEHYLFGGKCSGEGDGKAKAMKQIDTRPNTLGRLSIYKNWSREAKAAGASEINNFVGLGAARFKNKSDAEEFLKMCKKNPNVRSCTIYNEFEYHTVAATWDGTDLSKFTKFADLDQNLKRLTEGDETVGYKETKEKMAQYEKCKKHLMDKEQLSEEAAEERMANHTDDDVKKMAAEQDEKDQKLAAEEVAKKDAEMKRMASQKDEKAKLIALSKSARAANEKVRMAARKTGIKVRLSGLAARMKCTPAEIKALNIDELAGKGDEAIDAVIASYEKREPVIDVGLHGSTKAMNLGQLNTRLQAINMEKLETETRMNMPMKREGALKQMEALKKEETTIVAQLADLGPAADDVKSFDETFAQVTKLMADKKPAEAKEALRKFWLTQTAGGGSIVDQTAEMSALAEDMKKMQADFEEIVKLAAPAFGATAEELK
jgi:hypothetical protein